MEAIIWITALLVIVYLFLRNRAQRTRNDQWSQAQQSSRRSSAGNNQAGRKPSKPSKEEAISEALQDHWASVKASGSAPDWWFDAPTERQMARLREEGMEPKAGGLTKGQASDLIGLTEPADSRDEEILQFFKADKLYRGSQTLARIKAQELLSNPENQEAWEQRPARTATKEKARLAGVPVSKGITEESLQHSIALKLSEVEGDDGDSLQSVAIDVFEEAWDLANDREELEARDIKKPSASKIRAQIQAMIKETGDQEFAEDPPMGDDVLDALETDPSLSK
ncbi:hypothetical protein [Thioalkalivibrio sp. ALgr3]|uniref:hypothetical protein n=1 Tax=Thioalkalivibrio sp. ALgr3 TaxID=1239292 RepID=UPI0003632F16|nr:hypothetical protein [Thioalkalivibrio sp. ALgr3]